MIVFCWTSLVGAQQLCVQETEGDCPVAVEIPATYGSQLYCGSSGYFSTDGNTLKPGLLALAGLEMTSRHESVEPWDDVNYFRYYGRARIRYDIRCENGITYTDTLSWEEYSHYCNRYPGHNCSDADDHKNQFEEKPLSVYDAVRKTFDPGWGLNDMHLPEKAIIERWTGRKVGIPRYLGGTHKLSTPLLLINGLGFDYTSWGVKPAGEVGSTEWLEGKVTDYEPGSLPDVMARSYGLAKGEEINTNGIYFINLDARLIGTAIDTAALARSLIQRLQTIALQHVQFDSDFTPAFKMNIACHSTGCLVLNELLNRYASQSLFGYTVNLNDYINTIVAVDAPHHGTGLARDRAETDSVKGEERQEINGLPELFRELDGEAVNDETLRLFVQLDYSDLFWEASEGWGNSLLTWWLGTALDIWAEIAGLFGYDFSEFTLNVQGGLLGPHAYQLSMGDGHQFYASSDKRIAAFKNDLAARRNMVRTAQNSYLARPLQHPRRSDNTFVPYAPFYSENMTGLEAELITYLSNHAFSIMCENVSDMRCADVVSYAKAAVESKIKKALLNSYDDVDFDLGDQVKGLVDSLRTGWFTHSDLLVEKSSQVWDLENKDASSDLAIAQSKDLKEAKTYTLHQSALAKGHPDYPALHASLPLPFRFGTPAPLMGKDLFCALEAGCDSLSRLGANPLYAGEAVAYDVPTPTGEQLAALGQLITLVDDYHLYPLNQGGGVSGFMVLDSTGNTVAVVAYDSTQGTFVLTSEWLNGGDAIPVPLPRGMAPRVAPLNTLYARSLLPPEQRPQFVAYRSGDSLGVVVQGQAGLRMVVPLGSYGGVVQLVVLTDTQAAERTVLVGQGTPLTPQSTLPDYGSVQVILQEKRAQESSTARPWIWVANNSSSDLENLTLAYYFTADPARNPVAEMDYPRSVVYTTESLGDDHYKLVIEIPSLAARSVFPGQSGLQLRLHYADWTYWLSSDDYSAGIALPMPADHVVLRDAHGRILWGTEPPAAYFHARSVSASDPVRLELSISAAGTQETNLLRPKVYVKHSGGPSLEAGFRIVCFWEGLGRQGTTPTLEDWYSPDARGQAKRLSDGRLMLEWTFPSYRFYAGQQVSIGDWGVHWPDWLTLDKSGFATAKWVVLDAAGNVLLGKWPEESPAAQPGQSSEPVALQIHLTDAAPGETNQIRPQILLAHQGGPVLLAGYRVRLEFALPGSQNSQPVLEKWYSPLAEGHLSRLANGRVRLEWEITQDLFTGQSLSLGDWGLHWPDWSMIDKSGFSTANLTVYNKNSQEMNYDAY